MPSTAHRAADGGGEVDMGTYAGQSFTIGHDKGGLIGIAVIEHVGRTAA